MVSRYVTPAITLPAADEPFERADLIFYGVDHSGSSYEARLFADSPDADHGTGRDDPSYLGSFYIFGHGGCFGEAGHCDVPSATDPFDLRPPHQLTPAMRIVTITDSLRELVAAGRQELTITVVAHSTADHPNDVLDFETVRLATYA